MLKKRVNSYFKQVFAIVLFLMMIFGMAPVALASGPTWPTGLKATVLYNTVDHDSLTLSWPAAIDSSGITGYKILNKANNTTLAIVDANTLSYNFTGLTPSTVYSYAIEASDQANVWSSDLIAYAYTGDLFYQPGITWTGGGGGGGGTPVQLLNVYLTTISNNSSSFGDIIAGSSSVPCDATFKFNFSKNVSDDIKLPSNSNCFKLLDSNGATVPITVSKMSDFSERNNLFVTPSNVLEPGSEYKFLVSGDLSSRADPVMGTNYAITFSTKPVKPAPPAVSNDDNLNTVTGMAAGMEYKLDTAEYVAYDPATFPNDFSGEHTLLVRVAAVKANPASDPVTLTFTTNQPAPQECPVTYQGVQKKANSDGTFDIRFIATIDTLEPDSVGFVFSKTEQNPTIGNDATTVKSTNTVYDSIVADGTTKTADSLGGKYIIACTVTGISGDDITTPLYVRAFSTKGAETTYTSVHTVTVSSLK